MSALAEEIGWPFTYRDLSVAGVALPEEQIALLADSQHRPRQALTVGFLQDPFEPRLPRVANALDEDRVHTKWYLPGIVDLRPEWWEEGLQVADPVMLRYPTVPGKAVQFDRWMGDPHWGNIEGFRLWMLWPIDHWDVDVVLEEHRAMVAAHVAPVIDWLDAESGRVDPCGAYENATGAGMAQHEHAGDYPEGVWLCVDAERWVAEQWDVFCRLDDDGGVALKALPEPELPPELMVAWRNLVATSQQVSWQLHNALPTWDRPEVYRTERHYSPWLS